MEKRRKILLYGKSVILGSVGASLAQIPGLEIVPLAPPLPQAQQLAALEPDVIIFDLEAGHPDAALSLLESRPRLLLVGINPATDEMLLWSGEHSRALSMQDLVRAIGAPGGEGSLAPIPASKEVRIQEKSRQTPSMRVSVSHHKEKGETKMKKLSKRNRILLVGGVVAVVVIVAAIVFFPVAGVLLSGGSTLVVTPSSASVGLQRSVAFQISPLPFCMWYTDNPSIATVAPTSGNWTQATGWNVGTTTVRVRCGAVSGSATLTVWPRPVISPANPTLGQMWTITLSTGEPSTTWSVTSGSGMVNLSSTTGAAVAVDGWMPGPVTITATTAGGTATTTVTVVDNWGVVSPMGWTNVNVGGTAGFGTGGLKSGTWTVETLYGTPPVATLSPTTGAYTTVTGVSSGKVRIVLTADNGATSVAFVTVY